MQPRNPEAVLRRLEWTVIRRLDGLLQGDYRTLFRGFGLDLADLREYQYGDDVRHIDWNVTARLQSPYVREYHEDREVTAWFLLDLSQSVAFGSHEKRKQSVSEDFVAVLARVLTRHGNRVGALYYGERVSGMIPARSGRRQVLAILQGMQKHAGVKGEGAYSVFKWEAGTNRVQRVPATESQGRIHTSTATVAVMPEAEEVEVEIDQNDLKIDVYRSTGPGGQSVNTTDSAVRITHLPTGLVVAMQDEKSQLQNKQKALRVLRARLYELERRRQEEELSATRRAQIGTGERSEKIRTYNYPENRVTDHRIKLTAHRLDAILSGDLDEFTEALAAEARRRALEASTVSA